MKYFLSSSLMNWQTKSLYDVNGFVKDIQSTIPENCLVAFICADPGDYSLNDAYQLDISRMLIDIGKSAKQFTLVDNRFTGDIKQTLINSNLVFLAGGHVPTQNAFFHHLNLKETLHDFDGVLVAMSAGSMNSADCVYAQPEEDGEALDVNYQRFIQGLGITSINIIPHYQAVKDNLLDGLRLYEDITYNDSYGKQFYCLVDGSYLMGDTKGRELIKGESYLISNGSLQQLTKEGEIYYF